MPPSPTTVLPAAVSSLHAPGNASGAAILPAPEAISPLDASRSALRASSPLDASRSAVPASSPLEGPPSPPANAAGAGGHLATAVPSHSGAAVALSSPAKARRHGLVASAMAGVMAGRATIAEAGGDFTAREITENWQAARAMLAGAA